MRKVNADHGQTDANGIFAFRGFPGEYNHRLRSGGRPSLKQFPGCCKRKNKFYFKSGPVSSATERVMPHLAGKSGAMAGCIAVCRRGTRERGIARRLAAALKLCHDELGLISSAFMLFSDDMASIRRRQWQRAINWQNVDRFTTRFWLRMRPFVRAVVQCHRAGQRQQNGFWWRGNITAKNLDAGRTCVRSAGHLPSVRAAEVKRGVEVWKT